MASRPSSLNPVFWIFGGPNGSGKSTAYESANVEGFGTSIWIINPDLLTARLRQAENLSLADANLAAVQRIEAWLDATLRVHQSIGVETVLSTGKYRRLVELARALNFRTHLFYVMLDSPERNIERVRDRVLKGGHAVPEQKIIERYWRSLEQLPWFIDAMDEVDLYDNSGASPQLILRKRGDEVVLDRTNAPRTLLKALDLV
jgi:predicted ABC-type ATPase